MIIWINGAWGAGKTTVATELQRRVSNSLIFDPELAGSYLNQVLPKTYQADDFQTFREWRQINFLMLKKLTEIHNGLIIVPMTLINENYIEEILGELRESGIQIDHYLLEANEKELNKRLTKRLEYGNSWARQRIQLAITELDRLNDIDVINTNHLSVDEVVEIIGTKSQLTLKEETRSLMKRQASRFWLSLKEKINLPSKGVCYNVFIKER